MASDGNFNSCARSISRSKRHAPSSSDIGVQMQMDKIGVRHVGTLTLASAKDASFLNIPVGQN